MGLEVLVARRDQQQLPRSACRYQRLRGDIDGGGNGDDELVRTAAAAGGGRARRALRLRRRGCKTAAGRWRATAGGRRLLRLRLARWLVLLAPARRVAALVAELVRRLAVAAAAASAVGAAAAADCPAIVFSSQWGLPVLSHSASTGGRSARLRAFYLERSLSAGAGAGAGSPC
ncbi:hypothetical protein ACP4OV_028253 [Aristida adscensionis]